MEEQTVNLKEELIKIFPFLAKFSDEDFQAAIYRMAIAYGMMIAEEE